MSIVSKNGKPDFEPEERPQHAGELTERPSR
jgi:hypothetical protein